MVYLVVIVDPLVEDPLRSFEDRTTSVSRSQISISFPIQIVPEGNGTSGRHDDLK
jgi:hypothetical protein